MIERKEFEYHKYMYLDKLIKDPFVKDVAPFIEDLGDRFISISEYGLDSQGFGAVTKFIVFYHGIE